MKRRQARVSVVMSLGLVLLAMACDRKDPEKCQSALDTARQGITAKDFAAARKWRDYAYGQCDDPAALALLDNELVAAEQAVAANAVAAESKDSQQDQLLELFLGFVTEHRAAPEEASKQPDCQDTHGGAKQRWCKATRGVGGKYEFLVRYWEADPKLSRFTTRPPGPVTCADLGGAKTLRSWSVAATGGQAQRHLCQLTGALSGMQAVVTEAKGAELHVFTPEYLEADSALKKYAKAE